jgi:hypothetical protein
MLVVVKKNNFKNMSDKKGTLLGSHPIPLRATNQTFVKPFPHEIWKEYTFPLEEEDVKNRKYAFSNFGRFGSFYKNINEDMILVKPALVLGIWVARMWYLRVDKETQQRYRMNKSVPMHKALAELFIPQPSPEKRHVIHIDYNRVNNDLENLRWVTKEEMTVHVHADPKRIAKRPISTGKGMKLTVGQVKTIKKLLAEKKTRQRVIAQRFGISTTMIDYIKSGKKWAHVTID